MIWYLIRVVAVYIVVFVPSPPQLVLENPVTVRNCSRESSSIVRHFVHTAWRPIFKRFEVKMPSQCPLHFARDVFKAQELAKLHYRVNLWTCGICGKSFYREPYLDMHVASAHQDLISRDEMAVCYSDFCDIFRCKGYIKIRRSSSTKKNYRDSFTRILGSHEALYDLGINVHSEDDFTEEDSKALMTLPPQNILNLLNDSLKNKQFVVGIESLNIQDPYEFQGGTFEDYADKRDSRPRGGGGLKEKLKAKIERKKQSFQEEVDEIVAKTAHIIEQKLGRKLVLFGSKKMSSVHPGSDPEEEDTCSELEMNASQERCLKLIHDCISPLLVELSDSDFLQMEGLLHRQLCWYLTCDRHNQFPGVASRSTSEAKPRLEAYLILAVLAFCLSAVLLAVHYAVWLCFCQIESKQPPLRPKQLVEQQQPQTTSRPTHLPMFVQDEWKRNQ